MAKKWTADEYVKALDAYFAGIGLAGVSERMTGRTPAAVEDVVKHDIPRNYRNVITVLALAQRLSRSKLPWTRHETEYLRLLLKRLSRDQIAIVLGRTHRAIDKEVRRWGPQRGKERLV